MAEKNVNDNVLNRRNFLKMSAGGIAGVALVGAISQSRSMLYVATHTRLGNRVYQSLKVRMHPHAQTKCTLVFIYAIISKLNSK